MDQAIRHKIRNAVIQGRTLLENTAREELQGRFGIYVSGKDKAITIEDDIRMGHLDQDERETRKALLEHLSLLRKGRSPAESELDQFIREIAFTWLNRFVAFKMLEAHNLLRETVTRLENSNGFKMWLTEPGNEAHLSDYEKGDLPQNGRGEGPRQKAYRYFLLTQCGRLSGEIRILFDPDILPSRFLPQPRVLKELMGILNDPELAVVWQAGNEETVGWVYQGFNEQEKKDIFFRLYKKKEKSQYKDIPAATQLFTPRWIVRFLVENTLGCLWLEIHPDSELATSLEYVVSAGRETVDREEIPGNSFIKSVKEIKFLDPACGTMHFGLVAFDLFAEMYREEIENAGRPGWPEKPSVASKGDIPAAIITYNIHGIDIDLRAVQLSALTLYLKAKTLNPEARLGESRLACANVHMLDGDNLTQFVEQIKLGPIYRRILTALQARLKDSEQLGSLLRLEEEIRALIEQEKKHFINEGSQPDLFGLHKEQFETEADQSEFWDNLEFQIDHDLDTFARNHAGGRSEQSFFAGETTKGLRLLKLMAQRYEVVVTNPPYMTSRNMNQVLKSLAQKQYPIAKFDLYACFIQRCSEWISNQGRMGMIAQQSFMFISSYEKLREYLRMRIVIEVVPHVGPRAFEEVAGEKVNTVMFVFRREDDPETRQNAIGAYFRLVKEPDSEAKQRRFEEALANLRTGKNDPIVYHYRQGDFDAILGSPWVYWITPGLRKVFETFPKLGEIAQPRQGLATADNFRFLRYWWEPGVEHIAFGIRDAEEAQQADKRWFPYMKGGGFRRWYGNQEYVVNWEHNGKEICNFIDPITRKTYSRPQNIDCYFRRGVTYSYLASCNFSARLSSGGFIFDVAGSSLFPEDISLVLAILNSRFALYALRLINPTVNFQVGDLARLPVPCVSSDILRHLVDRAIALAKADSEDDETTWDFIAPPDWKDGIHKIDERRARLAEIERKIDEEVYRLYGISDEDRRAIETELAEGGTSSEGGEAEENDPNVLGEKESAEPVWSCTDLAKAWISYCVGVVMGQFRPNTEDGLGRGRINREKAKQLSALTDADGLLVVDPAHSDDLAAKVLSALELMVGEENTAELVNEALGNSGDSITRLRDYLADRFFKEHVRKYRKRPIYWYLRSARGNYGLWLYYHRLDKDILFKALLNYVEPKIRLEEDRLKTLRIRKEAAGSSGREAKQIEKDIDRLEQFVSELLDFADRLRRVAKLHLDFDLNDGVVLNIAPLWELAPWKEAKENWEDLVEGKYEWSSIGKQMREKGLVKK